MGKYEVKKVFKQVKSLPSGFGFYPKGTEVRFSPMTTGEIETLNESDLSSLMVFKSALEGIHPTFKQTPPIHSRSMIATFWPTCAARIAATYPPGPEPITTVSNSTAKSPTTIYLSLHQH